MAELDTRYAFDPSKESIPEYNERVKQYYTRTPQTPTPSVPTPTPASPTPQSTYLPRYTKDEQAASDYLGQDFKTPETEEQIQERKTKAAQAEIDSLNKYYDTLIAEQNVVNEERTRGTNAVSALTGLSGSSEAHVASTKTSQLNQRDNDKIQAQRGAAISQILSGIRTSAVEEAKQSRLEARQSAQDILDQRTKRQTESVTHLTNLAKSGVTADGLKATDPDSYAYLARNAGGDQQLRSIMTLNRAQETILDKKIENGKYIIAFENPLDGKIRVETVDLGIPTGYSKTIDAGDRILALPDNWDGDTSKLIAINKGLTPAQGSKLGGDPASVSRDFAATIDIASGLPKSVAAQKNLKRDLSQAIAVKDYKSAYQLILQATTAGLTAENATKLQNAAIDQTILKDLRSAIQAYSNAGGDMNILNGKQDDIAKRIGVLANDPEYAAIAVQLDRAFQQYRQNMTGAAFSDQESAEYAKVNPNKNNKLNLNLATIDGALRYADTYVKGAIRGQVGEGGVHIKEYAEGATAPTQASPANYRELVSPTGEVFDASDLSEDEYQQAISDGYVAQ